MAKIKSYTDLEQSKKLAEILPIESADMWWNEAKKYPEFIKTYREYLSLSIPPIPTWSLVALISVLPGYTLQTNTDGTFVVCDSRKPMISDAYDNPVDACVAMIESLHELKML